MEEQHQPISENLWWVIPGKLAGVRSPTAWDLDFLKELAIR
jgi:atypical dual specificity phosphatase